jgi:hypothetical protein
MSERASDPKSIRLWQILGRELLDILGEQPGPERTAKLRRHRDEAQALGAKFDEGWLDDLAQYEPGSRVQVFHASLSGPKIQPGETQLSVENAAPSAPKEPTQHEPTKPKPTGAEKSG